MIMKLLIMISILSVGTATPGIQTTRPTLLSDGFALQGVYGTLAGDDSNDVWFFKLGSDITDDKVILKAGTSLKLLPSVTLENIIINANERSESSYMLWGIITKYKGTNFIFPDYFTPLKAQPKSQKQTKKEQQEHMSKEAPPEEETMQKPVINDPNDLLTIPQEVIEKLKAAGEKTPAIAQRPSDSKRTQNAQMLPATEETPLINTKGYSRNFNSVLVDRTAYLDKQENNEFIFVLDGFGRNVPQVSYRLLPCEVLELAEQRQSAVLEPVRFKIAGIVTKYKGNEYLLPQKATRVYSHGNFGR